MIYKRLKKTKSAIKRKLRIKKTRKYRKLRGG